MSYVPPAPHKYYKRERYGCMQYVNLQTYEAKHNWWAVEGFTIGDRARYIYQDYESMEASDKWEPIAAFEYYKALDTLGRLFVDKAAAQLMEAEQPAPVKTKWGLLKELLGMEGT